MTKSAPRWRRPAALPGDRYIFRTFSLIWVMTCLENVVLPIAFGGLRWVERRTDGRV